MEFLTSCAGSFLQSVKVRDGDEMKKNDYLNRTYDAEIESFRALLCESDVDLVKTMIDQVTGGPKERISPIILSPYSNKAHRTVSFSSFSVVVVCIISYAVHVVFTTWSRGFYIMRGFAKV